LERLTTLDLESEDPLVDHGFVFRMVLQHEYQHNETILQTLQLTTGESYHPGESVCHPLPPEDHPFDDGVMVRFPGGAVAIGTDDRSASYDNERPRHRIELPPFLIDAIAVTEAAYAAFIAEGGYEKRELWSDEGWTWRNEAGVRHPKDWSWGEEGWEIRIMGRVVPADPRRPVCHVCYYEAEAYAAFMGKRLPTEFEWEASATWDPAAGTKRTYPWGEELPTQAVANVDVLTFGPAPAGSYVRKRIADRVLRDDRRRVGVDVDEFPSLSGVRDVSLRRVLRGFLRRRLQGPEGRVLGHAGGCDPGHLQELGLSRSAPDLQWVPLCQ